MIVAQLAAGRVSDRFFNASLWKSISTMSMFSRVIVPALLVALCLAGTQAVRVQAASTGAEQPPEATWNSIKGDIFKRISPILDGAGLVILDAPRRAENAALVPIDMRVNLSDDDNRTLQSLTLVIDENPARPSPARSRSVRHSGVTSISTRVRVDSYSYVRLVAELSDGKLYGVKAFVKAYGGCSAPAASNADAAKSALGQIKSAPSARKAMCCRKRSSCCGIRRTPACRWTS